MKQPKLHITDVKSSQGGREVHFNLDLDGAVGCKFSIEDASRGGSLPVSTDGGKTWLHKSAAESGSVVGAVRVRPTSDDFAIFCHVEDGSGSEAICAALVKRPKPGKSKNFHVHASPEFVTHGDKCNIVVDGPPSSAFRIGIGEKKYAGRTNKKGRSVLKFTANQIFSQDQMSAHSLVRVPVNIADNEENWFYGGSDVHFVPSVLRTLAATNDPARPGCVVLDPTSSPDQGLRFISQEAPCSDLAIVGPLYDPYGSETEQELTHLDSQYISVGEGFSSKFASISGGCNLIDHVSVAAKFFDPKSQSNSSLFPASDSDDRGLNAFNHGAWVSYCKPYMETSSQAGDCDVSVRQSIPVTRVFVASSSSAAKVMPSAIGRGLIVKPPAFTHSVRPKSSPSGVAAIVIRLGDGQEISLSATWSSSALQSLANQINEDIVLKSSGIYAEIIDDRLDVFSESKFSLLAGQVLSSLGGNAITVQQFSGASATFRCTTIKDLTAHGVSDMGTLAFLSGPFRGTVFSYIKSDTDSVRLQACPGINRPGGLVISDDIPCVHVAFLSGSESQSASVSEISLNVREDNLGQPASCVYPAISSSCRVVCQSQVDGSSQLFMYSELPTSQQQANNGSWMQLTYNGDNRRPRVFDDRYGNMHIVWERDVGDGTFVAYATIGPDSPIFSSKALVADFCRSSSPDTSPIIAPAKRVSSVLSLESSEGILELPFNSSNFLRNVIPSSSAYVKREFLGTCPSNIQFDASNPSSFMSNVLAVDGSQAEFDGVFAGDLVETVILHIDPSANTASQTYSGSISFNGAILSIAGQRSEMSVTDSIFSPTGIIFPSRAGVASFSDGVFTLSEDKMSFDFSLTLAPPDDLFQVRLIVAASLTPISIRTGWIKVADAGASVAMPRSDSVCLDYSPLQSKCCAIIPYYTDDSGRQFDGTHKSIGYMVDADIDIQPSFSFDGYILSGSAIGINPVISDVFSAGDGVQIRTDFYGSSPFFRGEQDRTFVKTTLDDDTDKLSGFKIGDYIAAHIIAIPPSSVTSTSSITFTTDILGVETDRGTVLGRHAALSSRSLSTASAFVSSVLVKHAARSIVVDVVGASDWQYALVYTKIPGTGAFLRNSSEDAVDDEFKNFLRGFSVRDDGLFDFDSNIMSAGKSAREFSDFIPLLSSLRLNDIHYNPSGVVQTSGLGYLESGGSSSFNLQCSDLVGSYWRTPSGSTFTRPAADGVDGVVCHYTVGVMLETVRFFARNTQTRQDWCNEVQSAGGSCDRYYEGLVRTAYTGRAKVVAYCVSSESSSGNGGVPYAFEIHESSHIIDVSKQFRLTVGSMLIKDHEHSIRTSRAHLDPLRFEGPEIAEDLVPLAHRNMIFCMVNGDPQISHDWRVDVSDGRRQFDLCFGSFISSISWFRHHDIGYRNGLAAGRFAVRISSIDISDNRLSMANGSQLSAFDMSMPSGFVQQANSFEQARNIDYLNATSDPGDWINMAFNFSAVDDWLASPTGFMYSGSVFARQENQSRAVVLQPNASSDFQFDQSIYESSDYRYPWMHSVRRGKVGHGGIGSISQSAVFADSTEYSIFLRAKRIEPYREDGSLVCPVDMVSPFLFVGGDQEAKIVRVTTNDFMGMSVKLTPGVGSLRLSALHPLYQKRAANLKVTELSADNGCAYVDSQGKLATDSSGSLTSFFSSAVGTGCLALVTNATHSSYDGTNYMMIMLMISDSGILRGFVNVVEVSSPDTALQTAVVEAFESDLASLGSSWRDISVGSTFAICVDGTGNLVFLGEEPPGGHGLSSLPSGRFVAVSCGSNYCVALREDGQLVNWGASLSLPSGTFLALGSELHMRSDHHAVNAYGVDVADAKSIATSYLFNPSEDSKVVDSDGLIIHGGTVEEDVAGSTAIVCFQGPFRVYLSTPGLSRRVLKYQKNSLETSEINDLIVDTYKDPFRSNIAIEHVSVVASEYANDEFTLQSVDEMYGFALPTVCQFGSPFTTGGLSVSRIGQGEGIQRSPAIVVDKLAKLHVAYESNETGTWQINVCSMRDWDEAMKVSQTISRSDHVSNVPSISADGDGRLLVAWQERNGNNSRIAASVSSSKDPDMSDSCLLDRAVGFIRTFDADPYDPYLPTRFFRCGVFATVRPTQTSTFKFVINFYLEDGSQLLYQAASTQNPNGWLLNGNTLSSEGQALDASNDYEIQFDAIPQDIKNQGVIRWELELQPMVSATSQESVGIISQKSGPNVEQLDSSDTATWPNLREVLTGLTPTVTAASIRLVVVQESAGSAPMSFPSRQPSDYVSLINGEITSNLSLPSGVTSIAGFTSGSQYRSFVIHIPAQVIHSGNTIDVEEFVQSTITFSAPIVAIVATPSDLAATDGIFGLPGTPWESAGSRAIRFADGEYITLSANLRTIDFRVKKKSESMYTQIRVITATGQAQSIEKNGYIFCPFATQQRCSVPASYTNRSSQNKLVHFRATIFTDAEKQNPIAVYDSLNYPTYWDAGRGSFPVGGVVCYPGNTISASFIPRVSPSSSVQSAFADMSSASSTVGSTSVSELQRLSILPHTRYYVSVEAEIGGVTEKLDSGDAEIMCDPSSYLSRSISWSGVDGRISYLSSVQSDAKNPSVAGSDFGLFYISWQDGRAGSSYSVDDPSGFRSECRFATYDSSSGRWSSVDGEGGSRPLYDS